jgi:hypothetical protein
MLTGRLAELEAASFASSRLRVTIFLTLCIFLPSLRDFNTRKSKERGEKE